ncbi:MAG TPA: ROK family protein [Phycisphaerae bacterium]|nr:ROK family protein [Phycisphaerae bacterium]
MNDTDRDQVLLGVDVGGTKTAVCAATASGEILNRQSFATAGPSDTINTIVSAARAMAERAEAIGVSCGGPLDWERGLTLSPPNLPGWDGVAITDQLSEALNAPAWLENDANAGALAEWRFGAGRGCRNMVFLTCGTGMGAGLILDGRLYRGTAGLSGEVGHIRLADDGPVGHNKAGSFEGFCSGGGIARLALRMRTQPHPSSPLDGLAGGELSARHVAQAADEGDRLAQDVIAESGRYLGRGLAVIVDVLNPELVVLGPLSWRLGRRWLDPAMRVLQQEALSGATAACRVKLAALRESIGDYAAIAVALDRLDSAAS